MMQAPKIRHTTSSKIDRYIGKQMRQARLDLDCKSEDFARCLGLTLENYYRAEDGYLRLSASDIFLLKREFNIPLANFFSWEGEYFSDTVLDNSEMADVFHYFSNIEDPSVRSHLMAQMKLASSVF